MKPEKSLKIKEEVKKQFHTGFLAVARYPEWVTNIMPVPKKDGRVLGLLPNKDGTEGHGADDLRLPVGNFLLQSDVLWA